MGGRGFTDEFCPGAIRHTCGLMLSSFVFRGPAQPSHCVLIALRVCPFLKYYSRLFYFCLVLYICWLFVTRWFLIVLFFDFPVYLFWGCLHDHFACVVCFVCVLLNCFGVFLFFFSVSGFVFLPFVCFFCRC